MSLALSELEPSRGILFVLAMIYAAIFCGVVAKPPKGWDQKHWFYCVYLAMIGFPFLLIIVITCVSLLLEAVAQLPP